MLQSASDYGGPRREFFMLMLREIKEKYFDLGLNETKDSDYYIVGLVIGEQLNVLVVKEFEQLYFS